MLCAICTMHMETKSVGFLVEPQNQDRWFVSGLASKPLGRFLLVWPQNHLDSFSQFDLKISGDGFSRFGLKTGGFGFSSLNLKTGSYVLIIWALKSSRRFPGLGIKIKRATVCRLHHKTDGMMKTVWDTHRDLAACFMWKQVGLGFFSLASRLVEA
jgi:hypothetical protein